MAKITNQDIEALIRSINDSHWQEVEISFEGCQLFLSKKDQARPSWASSKVDQNLAIGHSTAVAPAVESIPLKTKASLPVQQVAVDLDQGLHIITAPSLGTFYLAPKPGAAFFVEVGQKVEIDTELCLIEVMKLFTTLKSDVNGVVKKILVEDGAMIEHGQPIFLIDISD